MREQLAHNGTCGSMLQHSGWKSSRFSAPRDLGFDRLASESISVAENRRNLAISLLNLAAICSNAGRLREGLMLATSSKRPARRPCRENSHLRSKSRAALKSDRTAIEFRGQLGEIADGALDIEIATRILPK